MTALPRCAADWFFRPVALGRAPAMRFLAGAFIMVDWWWYMPWIIGHRHVPGELYQPLFIGRVLPLPVPDYWLVVGTLTVLLAAAVPMMFNQAPRLTGWIVAIAYFEWMIIAMSYGKVDHGKFAFLLLLFVLPTLPKSRWGDRRTLSEHAGWAFNLVQIGVVCTYFFAAWAKFRYGGFEWVNSATMTWAVIRRGTEFSNWLLEFPWMLRLSQWGIVGFELLSPVVLFVAWKRLRYGIVAFFYSFHVVVYLAVKISFLPHVVAMACFYPLEKIDPPALARKARRRIGRRRDSGLPRQRRESEQRAAVGS
ncbi:MFS transporter permease [Glycomyces xiaoerkulensis]|uniref:MFS transporter permease n=1 Tax=Glycomyces xiaoerkulensis TaxID=2038139 RepID=UPI000C25C50B|nr:MFS transporter permease [Glycomyces xiaoerkulensis]